MRRGFVLTTLFIAAVLLIACGGSDDSDTDDGQSGGGNETQGSQTQSSATSEPDRDAPAADVHTATLILDGVTYHFQGDEESRCNPDHLNGLGFRASLVRVDEGGAPITALGTTSGLAQSLLVTLAREEAGGGGVVLAQLDAGWNSGSDGTTSVEFTIDGNHAEGTGTFVTSDGDGPVDGSFEVTCAS